MGLAAEPPFELSTSASRNECDSKPRVLRAPHNKGVNAKTTISFTSIMNSIPPSITARLSSDKGVGSRPPDSARDEIEAMRNGEVTAQDKQNQQQQERGQLQRRCHDDAAARFRQSSFARREVEGRVCGWKAQTRCLNAY
jgi:hypothetical protein